MIAPDAIVDSRAEVSSSASIWGNAQVRENASVGDGTVIGRGAYIDAGVRIGSNCKIQNNALVYAPAIVEDGVFVGPAAVLTNDSYPRAINPNGTIKNASDWDSSGVVVHHGASIGAGAVVIAGIEIGEWAMVAAGAVVTLDVAPHALVGGVPARRLGWVGRSGDRLDKDGEWWVDPQSGDRFREAGEELSPG